MVRMNEKLKHRILIVDDERFNINILVELLKLEYTVIIAKNGKQALERANSDKKPDLILLDVMMPEMDGFETCELLKAKEDTKNIPIIFLTAKAEPEDIARGFLIGAVDYVAKPFNSVELLVRIQTHLELKFSKELLIKKHNEQKELLHILCHDLVNPFNSLQSLMEMYKEDNAILPNIEDAILVSIKNGLDTIGLIRQLRTFEDKSFLVHTERYYLHDLVKESIDILSNRFKVKGLKLDMDINIDHQVKVEKTSFINSVLNNILTNAVKFSFRGNKIELQSYQRENHTYLEIRDSGIGMSEKLLGEIFALDKSVSRKGTDGESGTGFGMPLVKKFMAEYGGEILVKSVEKMGNSQIHGTIITLKLLY